MSTYNKKNNLFKADSRQRRYNILSYALLGAMCLFFSFNTLSCTSETRNNTNIEDKTILGVWAHPDDETTSGPVFAKYARKGAEVILVIATDGRLGVNDWSGYDAGDELAAVRREEMQCAADVLGADLYHLEYEDQFRASEGFHAFIEQSRGFLDDLHDIIEERQPDIIITFGPDGGSNHIDHRIAGATATQVLLSKDWEKKPSLFFAGSPNAGSDNYRHRGVYDEFLTVRDHYTDEDADVAAEAAKCHASQFLPERVDSWAEGWRESGVSYFRPFEAPGSQADDLFSYPSQYPEIR